MFIYGIIARYIQVIQMKLLHASNVYSSEREGRFVYEIGGTPSGGDEYAGLTEREDSNEVRKLTSEELSKLLKKIVKLEAENDNVGDDRNWAEKLRDYVGSEVDKKDGVIRSVVGKVSRGTLNAAQKFLKFGDADTIADVLESLEGQKSGILLDFIKYHRKEALSLFTDKVSKDIYRFDFYGNNFLSDQTNLSNYFVDGEYLEIDGNIAYESANGYKIFSGPNKNKPLLIQSGDTVHVVRSLSKTQEDELRKLTGKEVGEEKISDKNQLVRRDLMSQVQAYKSAIRTSSLLLDSDAFSGIDFKLKEELKGVFRDFGKNLDGIDFANSSNDENFFKKKTFEISGLLENGMNEVKLIFLNSPDYKKNIGFFDQLIANLKSRNKIDQESKINLLNSNKESLNDIVGDKTNLLLSEFDKTGYKVFGRGQSLSILLGKAGIIGLSEEHQDMVLKVLKQRAKILAGKDSLKFITAIVNRSEKLISISKQKAVIWKNLNLISRNTPAIEVGSQKDFFTKTTDEMRSFVEEIKVQYGEIHKKAYELKFGNKKTNIQQSAVKVKNKFYDKPSVPAITERSVSFEDSDEGISYQNIFNKLIVDVDSLESLENEEKQIQKDFNTDIDRANSVYKSRINQAEEIANIIKINNSSPEEKAKFWKKVEVYHQQYQESQQKLNDSFSASGLDATTPEAQESIYNLSSAMTGMPESFDVKVESDGTFSAQVEGGNKFEIDMSTNPPKMKPFGVPDGPFSDTLKFDMTPENIPAIQIFSAMEAFAIVFNQERLQDGNNSMGKWKLDTFFQNLYPFRLTLDKNTLVGWKRGIDAAGGLMNLLKNVQDDLIAERGPNLPKLLSDSGELLDQNAPYYRQAIQKHLMKKRVD